MKQGRRAGLVFLALFAWGPLAQSQTPAQPPKATPGAAPPAAPGRAPQPTKKPADAAPAPVAAPGKVPIGKNNALPAAAPDPAWSEARLAALTLLKRAITQPFLRPGYGFPAGSDPSKIDTQEPLTQFFIPLRSLRAFADQQQAKEVLVDNERLVFPVTLNGEVRSAITLVRRDGTWQPAAIGPVRLGKGIKRAMDLAKASDVLRAENAPHFDLVLLGGVNLQLLMVETSKGLFFVPMDDLPRLKLLTGTPVPAEKVLRALKPEALQHNGLPT